MSRYEIVQEKIWIKSFNNKNGEISVNFDIEVDFGMIQIGGVV